jgi:hypothetical protein
MLLCSLFIACSSEPETTPEATPEKGLPEATALTAHPAYEGLLTQARAHGKDASWLASRASVDGDAIVIANQVDVDALEDGSNLVTLPTLPAGDAPKAQAGCSTTTTWCPGYGGVPGITGKTFKSATDGYGTRSCRYVNNGTQAPSYYYNSSPAGTYPCDKCCSTNPCPGAWGGTTLSPLGYCQPR